MSDYSKSYDGAAKDAAQSTIVGADFDTEFAAIETAVATKTNKVVPAAVGNVATLSGTGDLTDGAVTATELAILDGATVTTAELNVLDGIPGTLTATELGYVDGVTSSIQDQLDNLPSKRGALVYKSALQTIPNNTLTLVSFNSEDYDTDTIHDTVTNNDRLTVPSGVTKVRISAYMDFTANATGFRAVVILKNAGAFIGQPSTTINAASTGATPIAVSSAVLEVTGGDYFTMSVQQDSGGDLSLLGSTGGSWFTMEIIA